ncbi:MAG: hypothetical protein AB8I08_09220 [Sandaracinaceae bacterium]
MTTHRRTAAPVSLGLSLLLLLTVGCDGAATTPDAGSSEGDSGLLADAGPTDAGPPETDAGSDGGPDSGPDGGPMLGPHSMITMYLAAAPVTFPAVDESGTGVVVDAGFGLADGSVYFVADNQLHLFNPVTRALGTPMPLLTQDRTGTHSPDLMFAGTIGEDEFVGAIEGGTMMLWDFAPEDSGAPHFGAPAPLAQQDSATAVASNRAYMPSALDITNYAGFDTLVAASDDGMSLTIETSIASLTYFPVVAIETCSSNTPIMADHITTAVPRDATASTTPVTTVVSGDQVHSLEPGVLCFDDGETLMDESGTTISNPSVVFGANFDASSDGSDEVLVVVENAL